MQQSHFLLLLLFTVPATSGGTVAAEDQTSNLQTRTYRLLTNGDVRNAETEEGGVISAGLAKIKGVFGTTRNTALSSKITSLRKDPVVAVALESPAVKKLETAVEKDPKFFAKLRSDPESAKKWVANPEVARAAAALEKSNVKITKNDINELRAVASSDPVKASRLKQALGTLGWLVQKPAMLVVGIPALVVLFVAVMVGVGDRITKQLGPQ